MARFQLLVCAAICLLPGIQGHGAMSFPRSRNVVTTHNCPQCANGGSVCGSGAGSQWGADDSSASSLNGMYVTPMTQLIAGGKVEVEIYITAAHQGHFVIELCANPGSTITESCFVPLQRDSTDTRYSPYDAANPTYFFMPENSCANTFGAGNPMRARFIVPEGSISSHAVLRWVWQTGNSCDSSPASTQQGAASTVRSWTGALGGRTCQAALSNLWMSCGNNCPSPNCSGEQFRNCADVAVVNGDKNSVVTSSGAVITTPGDNNGGNNNNNNGGNTDGNNNNNGGSTGGNNNNNNGGNNNNGNNNNDNNNGGSNNGNNNGGNAGSSAGTGGSTWSTDDITKCQTTIRGLYSSWDSFCSSTCLEYGSDFTGHGQLWCKAAGVADLTACVRTLQAACV